MKDVNEIIARVQAQIPAVIVDQLQVSHAADDDGIWYFSTPASGEQMQIESSTGMCPFLVETNQTTGTARTVSEATSIIVRYFKPST